MEALGVPEVSEMNLGEALSARTAAQPSFGGLGPPDLCHVVKAFEPSSLPSLGLARAAAALGALSAAGVRVASFSLGQPSLDEVFFALTGHGASETPTDGAPEVTA